MKKQIASAAAILSSLVIISCGDSGPSRPTPTTSVTTTTAPPVSQFEITTLVTVYRSAASLAEYTQGTTTDEDLGKIMLGVGQLAPGTTVWDNEELRRELQDAIERINDGFTNPDFETAFDETRQNLRRFFNDADNDGWSVDGRHGEGRDWPHDGRGNGNDPDGWTAQMVITVSRR
jgi:hypothetical protein